MLVISVSEFKAKKILYFDKVDKWEQILIQRSKDRSYKINPVDHHNKLMSQEELSARGCYVCNRLHKVRTPKCQQRMN